MTEPFPITIYKSDEKLIIENRPPYHCICSFAPGIQEKWDIRDFMIQINQSILLAPDARRAILDVFKSHTFIEITIL